MQRWAEAATVRRHQSGFTLLELVIVIILVVLLFLTAWWRLMPLRGDAEAAHVATTIGTLRSALGLEVAERIARERTADSAVELDNVNPMTLLGQVPSNYAGEVDSESAAVVEAGTWYFDPESRQLRYRVRYPQYLADESLPRPVELAWRVRLSYRDNNDNGRFDADVDSLRSIGLEALDNPGWPDPDKNIPQALDEP